MSGGVTEKLSTLIIGYGNPLRRDDGVGLAAAQQLANDLDIPGVQVVACHQLTPELAEPISRTSRVIFIDACDGAHPGQVLCRSVLRDSESAPAFVHHLTPAALLACAYALYHSNPAEALVMTVNGACFEYGEGLTPLVAAALPAVTTMLAVILNTRFEGDRKSAQE
jgi:hydrogenase maturation protease